MKFLRNKLDERQEKGILRSLKPFVGGIDFYSNDYLGMARDPLLHERVPVLLAEAGLATRNGSGGSRLLSGNFAFYEETEAFLARFYGAEAALVYHSGYDALLGTLSCLPGREDTVLYDALIHASARDGIRLSWAKSHSFAHNDVDDLEAKLQKAQGTVFVVVESLYSMDGDLAPLAAMAELQKRYGFVWLIDEAHAGGVYGEQGRGLAQPFADNENVVRFLTFGKAYGVEGACVLGSRTLREYLINFSRPFIYTTAPAPGFFAKIRASVERVAQADEARTDLEKTIRHFQGMVAPYIPYTDSSIQIFKPGNAERLKNITTRLTEAGVSVRPIYPPTVPAGQERLRIILHAFNTVSEVDALAKELIGQIK